MALRSLSQIAKGFFNFRFLIFDLGNEKPPAERGGFFLTAGVFEFLKHWGIFHFFDTAGTNRLGIFGA